jgi:hypothetical protein
MAKVAIRKQVATKTERLAMFDAATARQQRRNRERSDNGAHSPSTRDRESRSWSREDLYAARLTRER